jgi:hypothetical protein
MNIYEVTYREPIGTPDRMDHDLLVRAETSKEARRRARRRLKRRFGTFFNRNWTWRHTRLVEKAGG